MANFAESGLWQAGHQLANDFKDLWNILSAPQLAEGLCLKWACFLLLAVC